VSGRPTSLPGFLGSSIEGYKGMNVACRNGVLAPDITDHVIVTDAYERNGSRSIGRHSKSFAEAVSLINEREIEPRTLKGMSQQLAAGIRRLRLQRSTRIISITLI